MDKEEIYALLNDKGIAYQTDEHKAIYNMAELNDIKLLYRDLDAKNLF